MRTLSFGTEGYRGVIGYDFGFQTVERITKAISAYLIENKGRRLIVGYDTRFLSREFAEHAANIASKQGIEVLIADTFCPSPVLSNAAKSLGFNGGIMITASHNPPRYNGIKFKAHYGGAVTTDVTDRLSSLIEQVPVEETLPQRYDQTTNITNVYRHDIERFINRDLHASQRLGIVIDPMYGAGQRLLASLFEDLGHRVTEVRGTVNPSFGGTNPEPVDVNVAPLKEAVVKNQADIGIALDGDADRIALVDEKGQYVDAHRVFGLLIMYLVEEMGLHADVAKTVSGSGLIDRLCAHYGLKLQVTRIGFKHICDLMQHGNVMIGGEESGGIGVASHIPERDALLASILITQLMLAKRKTLRSLIDSMEAITGRHYYRRKDLQIRQAAGILDKVRNNRNVLLEGLGAYTVDDTDGLKFVFKDGGFLMVRASGTEPILRIYAELDEPEKTERVIDGFITRLGEVTGRTV